jgi:hypothetical protein
MFYIKEIFRRGLVGKPFLRLKPAKRAYGITIARALQIRRLVWNFRKTAFSYGFSWNVTIFQEGTSKNIRLRRDDRRLRSPRCRFNGRRPFIEAI